MPGSVQNAAPATVMPASRVVPATWHLKLRFDFGHIGRHLGRYNTRMSELDDRLQALRLALAAIIEPAVRQCQYAPEQYQQTLKQPNLAEAIRRLIERASEDSIQLFARHRPELTIEGLASSGDWNDLFSEHERELASKRCTSLTAAATSSGIQPANDEPAPLITANAEDDDIVWGEELLTGVGLCDKLARENLELQSAGPIDIRRSGGWPFSVFRKHLAECEQCNHSCQALTQRLDAFDIYTLGMIRELLGTCLRVVDVGYERARSLLRREWRAAGIDMLPSEAVAAGITEYRWHKPAYSEQQQLDHWQDLLCWRAAQVFRQTGKLLVDYEETHDWGGNPWITWRSEKSASRVARFVHDLTRNELLALVISRNIGKLYHQWSIEPLSVPSDGDVQAVAEALEAVATTDASEWERILASNFCTRTLHISTMFVDEQSDDEQFRSATPEASTTVSRPELLDWRQLLFLASAAASRAIGDSVELPATCADQPQRTGGTTGWDLEKLLSKVDDHTNTLAFQHTVLMQMVADTARDVQQLREGFRALGDEPRRLAEETVRDALGELYELCSERTQKFLITAECHYQQTSADLDFSAIVVQLTKSFESALQSDTRLWGFLTSLTTEEKIVFPPTLGKVLYAIKKNERRSREALREWHISYDDLRAALERVNSGKGAKHTERKTKAEATTFRSMFLGNPSVLTALFPPGRKGNQAAAP